MPYAVPVYVGGGYGYGPGAGYYDNGYPPDQGQAAPSQPNVIVVYPPQAPAVVGAPGAVPYAALPPAQEGQAPEPAPAAADHSQAEASHFLIAFKDHTVYSAVAYWVEGDTLHYFSTPSTHNQISLSLIDKDLTERLNREAGIDMHLPK